MKFGRTEITPGFFLVLAALIFFDMDKLLLHGLVAAAMHEAAHLAAAGMLGGRVGRARLSFSGAEIELDGLFGIDYLREALIYLTGPIANVFVAIAASWTADIFGFSRLFPFAGMNLVLGFFNLLPCRMLDGGNALRCVCVHFFGRIPAFVRFLHVLTTVMLIAAGVVLIIANRINLSLLLISVYILVCGLLPGRHSFRGLPNES